MSPIYVFIPYLIIYNIYTILCILCTDGWHVTKRVPDRARPGRIQLHDHRRSPR